MKVHLLVCPEKGEKPEYTFAMEMPSLPHSGDYLSVLRIDPKTKEALTDESGQLQFESYVVVRRRFVCHFPDDGKIYNNQGQGFTDDVGIELRPAKSYYTAQNFEKFLSADSEKWEWG
ncbi:hypothetical protein [Henriciella litoralis]|uniref:hypothetical protein n=1 Tax=Henriciella litoralis TaxID=568102 RepID=UPI000A013F7A|nr:hypothetical protein [Henriciella litoralis]